MIEILTKFGGLSVRAFYFTELDRVLICRDWILFYRIGFSDVFLERWGALVLSARFNGGRGIGGINLSVLNTDRIPNAV